MSHAFAPVFGQRSESAEMTRSVAALRSVLLGLVNKQPLRLGFLSGLNGVVPFPMKNIGFHGDRSEFHL